MTVRCNQRPKPPRRPRYRAYVAVLTCLPLLGACGSKNQDSLVGKNVDLNAIVGTNSDEMNAAGNDLASAGAAASPSSSASDNSGTSNLSRPTPTKRSSESAPAEVERGDSTSGNDTAPDQTQDETSTPSNLE